MPHPQLFNWYRTSRIDLNGKLRSGNVRIFFITILFDVSVLVLWPDFGINPVSFQRKRIVIAYLIAYITSRKLFSSIKLHVTLCNRMYFRKTKEVRWMERLVVLISKGVKYCLAYPAMSSSLQLRNSLWRKCKFKWQMIFSGFQYFEVAFARDKRVWSKCSVGSNNRILTGSRTSL